MVLPPTQMALFPMADADAEADADADADADAEADADSDADADASQKTDFLTATVVLASMSTLPA